jgi:hypothetical protein
MVAASVSINAPALADGKLYRCTGLSQVGMADDGTLKAMIRDDIFRQRYAGVLIDTATGVIRWPGRADLDHWEVVQKGGSANDVVLVVNSIPRHAATDFIRIRAWSREPQIRFFHFALSNLISGTCEAVQ